MEAAGAPRLMKGAVGGILRVPSLPNGRPLWAAASAPRTGSRFCLMLVAKM